MLPYFIDFFLESFLHLFLHTFYLQIHSIVLFNRPKLFELKDDLLLEDWLSWRKHHIHHHFDHSIFIHTIKAIIFNYFFPYLIILMLFYFLIDLLLLCDFICEVYSIWEYIEYFSKNGWILLSFEIIKVKKLFIDKAIFQIDQMARQFLRKEFEL